MARNKGRSAQGLGSVFKRKDGRWVAQVLIGYNDKGRPRYKLAYCKSEDEATKALLAMQAELTSGRSLSTDRQTVAKFLDNWMETAVEGHKAPSTIRYYRLMVDSHIKPAIGRTDLRKLQAVQVEELIKSASKQAPKPKSDPRKAKGKKGLEVVTARTLSPHTVRGIRAVLRSALNYAWKLGMVGENVALKTTPPKVVKADPVYLSPEDAQALLQAAEGHPIRNLVALALGTGLRVGEATGLRWQDVDFQASTLRVQVQLQRVNGKLVHKPLKSSSSRRNLPILGLVLGALQDEQRRQENLRKVSAVDIFNPLDFVFLNDEARPMDGKYVDKHLKKLCGKAKIAPVSFHKLRHTAATHMVAAGVPLALVKDQLGHSSIVLTTSTYAHMVPAAQREAAEKLDQALRAAEQL